MRKDLTHEVVPSHYDLLVNVEEESFNGSVSIQLLAANSVKTFLFNSTNLKLSDLKITKEGTTIPCFFDYEEEFVVVTLENEVVGEFSMTVAYEGHYNESMEGFYKSKYNTNDLYSTQFQATDARKAFPCFDQPDMKATFAISINAPEEMIALSNNKVKSREGNLFVFETTPAMSTYIVAYVIGKLEYLENNSLGFPIRVYADPTEIKWAKFSLDIAVRCLGYFEKYFGIKYPLPKLDMVAIQSFAAGAMENWGLITYRKTSLLLNDKASSINAKERIAGTVCHELAHMWFGNLVTMKWWSDLWLNEGFATWAASLAIANSTQDIFPFDAWTYFANDNMNSGMEMDSIQSTHMIGIEVDHPSSIDQIFDAISYDKGSAVIRMLEAWLGAETFRLGLVHYLKKFQYKNTVTSDLWDSLSFVANQNNSKDIIDVASVIDPWVKRDGFPYIKVEDLGDRLRLTQERFTIGYKKSDKPWPIPINILWIKDKKATTYSTLKSTHLMTEETIEIKKLTLVYKLNDDVTGFYRVLYPESYIKNLLQYELTSANRLNIFSDAFALSIANIMPVQSTLNLLNLIKNENNYDVLSVILEKLEAFRKIFYDNTEKKNHFNKKIIEIVKDRIELIDFKVFSKDINTASVNSLIVASAVGASHEETIKSLKSHKLDEINPEYMRSYFIACIDSDFTEMFEKYKTCDKPGEKQHLLFSLGKTSIEENIDFLFKNLSEVEPHDMIYLFVALGSNLTFRTKVVGLFISNYELLKKHVNNSCVLRNCLQYVLAGYVEVENNNSKVLNFLESLKTDCEMKSAVKKSNDYINVANSIRDKYSNITFK